MDEETQILSDSLNKIEVWLRSIKPVTTAIVGLGNPDRADDCFGLDLAERLREGWPGPVYLETQQSVEGIVFDLVEREGIDAVCFLDAMDFGGKPGEVDLFGFEDADKFVPAFSTHKVPITLLMGILAEKKKRPYLLGIQPVTITLFGRMSDEVNSAMNMLIALF